jgi:hypothetical protein
MADRGAGNDRIRDWCQCGDLTANKAHNEYGCLSYTKRRAVAADNDLSATTTHPESAEVGPGA